jgi:hypothetical protein
MKFIIAILFIFHLTHPVQLAKAQPAAQAPFCRVYTLLGTVRDTPDGYAIITAPGTRSETQFKVATDDHPRVIPFLNTSVSVQAIIREPALPTRAQIATLESIQRHISNPVVDKSPSAVQWKPCPSGQ